MVQADLAHAAALGAPVSDDRTVHISKDDDPSTALCGEKQAPVPYREGKAVKLCEQCRLEAMKQW